MADESFKADRSKYGEELCGTAELLSDQFEMAKALLQHHFPESSVHQNAHVVLSTQERLQHLMDTQSLLEPMTPGEEAEELEGMGGAE